mgnify:CR=1 FL=1
MATKEDTLISKNIKSSQFFGNRKPKSSRGDWIKKRNKRFKKWQLRKERE